MAHGFVTPIGELMLQPRLTVRLRGTSFSGPAESAGWSVGAAVAAAGAGSAVAAGAAVASAAGAAVASAAGAAVAAAAGAAVAAGAAGAWVAAGAAGEPPQAASTTVTSARTAS